MTRNYLLLLMVLVVIFSCSNEDNMPSNADSFTNSEDSKPQTRAANTPDHALGFSYDATGEYLDQYSIRRSVIDVAKLRAYSEKSVVISEETDGGNKYNYGHSSYEYLTNLHSSWDIPQFSPWIFLPFTTTFLISIGLPHPTIFLSDSV